MLSWRLARHGEQESKKKIAQGRGGERKKRWHRFGISPRRQFYAVGADCHWQLDCDELQRRVHGETRRRINSLDSKKGTGSQPFGPGRGRCRNPPLVKRVHPVDANGAHPLPMPMLRIQDARDGGCAGALSSVLVGGRWPGRQGLCGSPPDCKRSTEPKRGTEALCPVRRCPPPVHSIRSQAAGIRAMTLRCG